MIPAKTLLRPLTLGFCCLIGAGCSLFHPAPEITSVTARIERVETKNQEFLFPASSGRINSVTDLKLIRLDRHDSGDNSLDLIFSGLPYTPSVDGAVGDTIEFGSDEAIPWNGELEIKHVKYLRVAKKAG